MIIRSFDGYDAEMMITGRIWEPDGFFPGTLYLEESGISIEESASTHTDTQKNLIIPLPINMHTHLGDAFVYERGIQIPRNLEEVVKPPDGLKHRLLRSSDEKEIIGGMEKALQFIESQGTLGCIDFREGGLNGISLLEEAKRTSKIQVFILGRPEQLTYDSREIEALLSRCDGFGLSAVRDWNIQDVESIAEHAHKKNKILALHASEKVREDIESILSLDPSFLVHMLQADNADLRKVADHQIPIVLCPRSNAFFRLPVKLDHFKNAGVDLMLGSDNAMLGFLNVLDELRFLKGTSEVFSLEELVEMVVFSPRKYLKGRHRFALNNLYSNGFIVLDGKTLETVSISTRLEV